MTTLPIHLPNSLRQERYHRSNPTPTLSNLEHYFARPEGTFLDGTNERHFRDISYAEYFAHFRLLKFDMANGEKPGYFLESQNERGAPAMHVVQRDPKRPHLSRIQSVHASRGELFYLRSLLLSQPATDWTDLRTINGTVHPSFQSACVALGIFASQNEAQFCMQEAVDTFRTPYQLRILFVHLLTNSCVSTPLQLWDEFRHKISEDFILEAMGDVEQGCNEALIQLGSFLQGHGKHLGNYGLPQPIPNSDEVQRELRRWAPQAASFQQ